MKITFKRLTESDLGQLLVWLEAPHVKEWWDTEVVWTSAKIYEKYATYLHGYKVEEGESKPIDAFMIYLDDLAVGYVQAYNAYDFKRTVSLRDLPLSLAAFDIFLGEKDVLQKGVGSLALRIFFDQFWDKPFEYAFADPDRKNKGAIRAYEKAGFEKLKDIAETNEVWMLKKINDCGGRW